MHGVHRRHEGAAADGRRGGLGEAAGTQFNTVFKDITLIVFKRNFHEIGHEDV